MSKIRRPYGIWRDESGEDQQAHVWWRHPYDLEVGSRDVQYMTVKSRPCNLHRVYIGGPR